MTIGAMSADSGESPRTPGAAPTIYDVARRAGVAPSTVSRTFARPGRVSFDTAERVRAAAEALGYRTRSVARTGGEGRRSNLIG